MLVYQFDSCARIRVIDNLKRESERNKLSRLVPKTNAFNCTDFKYEKDRLYIFEILYLLIRTKYCRFAVIKLLSPNLQVFVQQRNAKILAKYRGYSAIAHPYNTYSRTRKRTAETAPSGIANFPFGSK